jgi:hypothetical protein
MSQKYERVRHLKRGIEAEVLGEAEVQIATTRIVGEAPGKALLIEGDKLTIYREGTKLWARFTDEFRDGRFETIESAAPKPEPKPTISFDDATVEDMEHTARTLEMFVPRDPRAGPTYLALVEILRAEAAKRRAS